MSGAGVDKLRPIEKIFPTRSVVRILFIRRSLLTKRPFINFYFIIHSVEQGWAIFSLPQAALAVHIFVEGRRKN
jgi:hypothetical protein